MKSHAGAFLRLVSVPVLTVLLIFGFACFAPQNRLLAVAAQSTLPNGSYGFLINSSFSSTAFSPSSFPAGLAILGVMNLDGAGNVTGPYTYEVDTNNAKVPHTTTGAFTGTYSSNPDGSFTVTIALDNGINLTLAMVVSDSGQALNFVATNFQFPAASCGCTTAGILLTGIGRPAPGGSLNGTYAYQLYIWPNTTSSLGLASFDGAGNVTLSVTFVGAADGNGQPSTPFTGTMTGTYSTNPDGTGSINFPAVPGVSNTQNFVFVITDNGARVILMQIDRAGNGVQIGTGQLQ